MIKIPRQCLVVNQANFLVQANLVSGIEFHQKGSVLRGSVPEPRSPGFHRSICRLPPGVSGIWADNKRGRCRPVFEARVDNLATLRGDVGHHQNANHARDQGVNGLIVFQNYGKAWHSVNP